MKQPDFSNFYDLTFKSVLDALPCHLTIQDANLNVLFANQTFIDDFGNGIGKPCYKVFHGSEHECAECPVQKTFMDKNVHKEFFSTKGDTGTGLGLLVVDRIVRNHKGKIEILTKSGIGSSFRMIFRIQ